MTRAIAIYPDKRVLDVEVDGLDDMQALVEGKIQPVDLTFGSMYVNDEYLFQFTADDFNSIGSDVAGLGGRADLMLSGIRGPVFLVGPVDSNGYETDVTDDGRKAVRKVGLEAGMVPADFGLTGAAES